jgi:hypothetical protein
MIRNRAASVRARLKQHADSTRHFFVYLMDPMGDDLPTRKIERLQTTIFGCGRSDMFPAK